MEFKNNIKFTTHIIYTIIYKCKLEFIFYLLSRVHPIFRKFIPQPLYYKNTDIRLVKRNGTFFKLNLSDYMQWHIFAGQPDKSWVYAKNILKDNSVILDIGANCGAFSLKLATMIKRKNLKNCKILAFEPNPFILNYLYTNLELNPSLKDIIQILPIGIGQEDGLSGFQFSESNSGGGKVCQNNVKNIKIRKLDTLLNELGINTVSFLKIDVEGFEPFVLKGGKETICKYQPPMYVEITDKWFREYGTSSDEILDWIHKNQYNLFVDDEKKLRVLNLPHFPSWLKNLSQYNVLALPCSKN